MQKYKGHNSCKDKTNINIRNKQVKLYTLFISEEDKNARLNQISNCRNYNTGFGSGYFQPYFIGCLFSIHKLFLLNNTNSTRYLKLLLIYSLEFSKLGFIKELHNVTLTTYVHYYINITHFPHDYSTKKTLSYIPLTKQVRYFETCIEML